MRIISGKYKGKQIKGFDIEGTRPTMDRVKESLFAMIQNYVQGSTCLDLFAGSGSLGIEALSNGGKICYFVDNNPKVIQILKENTKQIEHSEILFLDYQESLVYFKKNHISFDLIFLDPPYQKHLLKESIQMIEEYQLLRLHGILVCEFTDEEFSSSYSLIKEKTYHDKKIRIYQNEM